MKPFVVSGALETAAGHRHSSGPELLQCGPVVVVPAVAAHIKHGVDGAGAAQGFAAWLVARRPLQAGLRHGFKDVVVDFGRHHGHHAGRGRGSGRCCLGPPASSRQTVTFRHSLRRRQYTTGRARAPTTTWSPISAIYVPVLCRWIVKSGELSNGI